MTSEIKQQLLLFLNSSPLAQDSSVVSHFVFWPVGILEPLSGFLGNETGYGSVGGCEERERDNNPCGSYR